MSLWVRRRRDDRATVEVQGEAGVQTVELGVYVQRIAPGPGVQTLGESGEVL
jgi:hypothetical protein